MSSTLRRALITGAAVLFGTLGQAMGPLAPQASAADVVPNFGFGDSYAGWSAKWWQWLLSIPSAINPDVDPTGGNCAQGQSGPVWFLAGTLSGSATRTCTMPAGKAIFFPMINAIGFKPKGNETLNDLRLLVAGTADNVTALTCTIDDTPCAGDLLAFRATSPVFTVNPPPQGLIPPGNLTAPASTDTLVSDGYWMLIAPLPVGTYTIKYGGTSGGFSVDVTYTLKVLSK